MLSVWTNIPELFRSAPYEDWDEICSYNHTRPMGWASFKRVPSYGALDTFEFALARKWHQIFDRKAEVLRDPLWANGVPQSFRDNRFLVGEKIWQSYAAIDYNYARGICDRSVIITARKIDFIATYLLLSLFLTLIISTLGFGGMAICIPLTWYLFSYGFRWSVVRALPGGQAAMLAGAIFFLLLLALKNKSIWPLHLSTALCAISANLKADSLTMAIPIFLTYLLVQVHTLSTFSIIKLATRWLIAVAVFLGTALLTNVELAIRPRSVINSQKNLLLFVGSGQRVNLHHNFKLLGAFLHDNLLFLFVPNLSPERSWEWQFLAVGLGLSGLFLVLAKFPPPEVRWSMVLITLVTLFVLWGIPIFRVPIIYPRYFVSGFVVVLIAFGFGFYLWVNSFRIERSFPVWGLLVVGTISCLAGARPWFEASVALRHVLAENFGLDPTISRNRATLEIWKLLKTGNYDQRVMVDQHSYSDLRFFFDRGVPVVMINAWDFQEVLNGLAGAQKPVLGLHVPGVYEDKSVPSWVGRWTPEWEEQYDEFDRWLSTLPRIYNFDGNKMRLLDWTPVQGGDSVFVFAFGANDGKKTVH
jgi:hypothetical protein